MSVYKAVYFKINRYHAGESWSLEDSSPVIHSDTFFGGLVWSYRELYGRDEVEAFIEACRKKALLFSSLYPCRIGGANLCPLPLNLSIEVKELFKERPWAASEKLFRNLIEGASIKELGSSLKLHGGALYAADEEPVELRRMKSYKNVKDRLIGSTDLWRLSYCVLGDGCGLRLLYKVIEPKEVPEKKLASALRLLSENGLGGERSTGLGGSSEPPIIKEESIDEPKNTGFFMTLSLYYPTRDEIEKHAEGRSYYELVERRGFRDYRAGGQRNSIVRIFREGSVFPVVSEYPGSMVDVDGVYRYGLAYPVSVRVIV
jgi:CRISPR-associated protein Csm4